VEKRFPSWSLHEALRTIETHPFNPPLSQEHKLLKAVFLVALASGNRVSELAAMDRSAIAYTDTTVTIPVKRGFLYKNQTWDRLPPEITFPTLAENIALCPVAALRDYVTSTEDRAHRGHVFLYPSSSKPLTAATVAYWLAKAIRTFASTKEGRAHDLRKLAFSIAWVRGVALSDIIAKAFWSSPNVFIKRYLDRVIRPPTCIAGRSAQKHHPVLSCFVQTA
jgi:integrase